MTVLSKNIEEIRGGLLDPAFEMIKDYLISRGHKDPEIVCEKDAVEVLFNNKRGKICKYRCWINANGKVYRNVRRPPDTIHDFSGCDASKVTHRMILEDFENFFRIGI